MKDPAIFIHSGALGDVLCATPTIRKISRIYNRKVLVASWNPEVLKNHPDVSESLNLSEINQSDFSQRFDVQRTFDMLGKQDQRGVEFKHAACDIRQFHAKDLGFLLKPDEMSCDYYPSDESSTFLSDLKLPENYIVIHPVKSWESRTWGNENWQRFCDSMRDLGVFVVAVGKNTSEQMHLDTVDKPTLDINIEYGMDLMNKTNLDQTWRILNGAFCVVTMDSGIMHLAGTTDTHIIQLGSSVDPLYRTPYRHGRQDYRYSYIQGECKIHCASDMRYSLRDWGGIQNVTLISTCLEPGMNFKCKPSIDPVVSEVLKVKGVNGLI